MVGRLAILNYIEMFRAAIKKHHVFYKNTTSLSKVLHIGYGIDDNYARCMAASIASVCENNKKHAIVFHILAAKLQQQTIEQLEALARCFSVEINLYEIDDSVFQNLPTQVHFPVSIYYRYILPLVLKSVDRLLYIDADIINLKPLTEILQMDLNACTIAAVPDVDWMGDKRNKVLGLSNHQYFNSGVLLIDVSRWNDFDVLGKSMKALQKNPKLFRYPDQDALNLILTGKVHYMDRTYNCIDSAASDSMKIVLLHFAAHPKPWNIAWPISKLCTDFTRDIYRQYEAMTPWQGSELQMPRNYKEMKVYAKCLWRNGKYADALLWQVKYIMKKLFH